MEHPERPGKGPWAAAALCMLCLLFRAPLFPGFAADTDAPSVARILEKVQQRYGAGDLQADFVQESHMEAMGIVDKAKGHVYFKPPFMMRWHYLEPEEYLIITDGKAVWIHRPRDRQVMVGGATEYFGGTNFAEFFSKPAKLDEHFSIEPVLRNGRDGTCHVLRLVPYDPSANVQEVFLFISKKTYDIVQSDTYNAFGDRTRLRFSDFKIDQGLDEGLFHFSIPEDEEIDVLRLDRPL